MTIPGGGGDEMGKFCAYGADGLKYWWPAVAAQSGDSYSGIAQTFYGNGATCYAQNLAYLNTGSTDTTLDVGQTVGLPGGLGPCDGIDISLDCTQVPTQADLPVIDPPPDWMYPYVGNAVCGFETC